LFEDEARFGRIQTPKTCWSPRKTRPHVPAQEVRQFTHSFGAVNPKDGTWISLILPRSDTQAMNLFLKEIEVVYPCAFVVMLMDQAPWHKSKTLEVPKNIKIAYIPPYSPECNPVEMAWKTIRKGFFHNTYFKSLEAVNERLYQALQYHVLNKSDLKSACGFNWATEPILNAT
jgi:putative transposase